ncbi:hypothetical protein PoB_005792600 [Plakobranchus ocellatus]|uniref:Uncharacterized protein n=1 Tax=Plakobranchus ocellatus TaxID=259542 RepID=A0AAV4C7Z2_9GAST|nr:hypothetical protein PoB_005792600 [Plakobranchus ocellatus]
MQYESLKERHGRPYEDTSRGNMTDAKIQCGMAAELNLDHQIFECLIHEKLKLRLPVASLWQFRHTIQRVITLYLLPLFGNFVTVFNVSSPSMGDDTLNDVTKLPKRGNR